MAQPGALVLDHVGGGGEGEPESPLCGVSLSAGEGSAEDVGDNCEYLSNQRLRLPEGAARDSRWTPFLRPHQLL